MNDRKALFTRPLKAVELIAKEPSESKAFEVAEEWAASIRKYEVQDRFGMRLKPLRRGYWGVYLVDRYASKDS